MIWLAPWALGVGAAGMLGVVAAHLLSRQRPRAVPLATARFLPAGMLEATTLQRIPMDRWWMLLRLLILALLAAGVAQPVFTGARVPRRTVLLLDRMLPIDMQRAALRDLSASDAVIAFDTATALSAPAGVAVRAASRASLSAALARLVRVRDSLAAGATQLRIEIASPFAPRSLDVATATLRALIADSIVPRAIVLPADSATPRGAITVHASDDDPIAATAMLAGNGIVAAGTIIQRGAALTADDSAAARRGATVLHWPARTLTDASRAEALTAGGATWIATLDRDSVPARDGAYAVAWWADGAVAARAEPLGTGCVVHLRAALPLAGDQTLSLSAQAVLAALLATCERVPLRALAPPSWLVAPSRAVAGTDTRALLHSTWAPWLVGGALLLAAAELALRLRSRA